MKANNLDANHERLNEFLRRMSKGYFNEYYRTDKTYPDYNPDHTDPDSDNDYTEKNEENNDHSIPEKRKKK